MADACPNVHYFNPAGVVDSSKGKFHAAEINPGRSANAPGAGGNQKITLASGGAGATPAVHKHSGTEDFGAKVTHKAATPKGPGSASGADATPEGVRTFSGTAAGSAPKKTAPKAPPLNTNNF